MTKRSKRIASIPRKFMPNLADLCAPLNQLATTENNQVEVD